MGGDLLRDLDDPDEDVDAATDADGELAPSGDEDLSWRCRFGQMLEHGFPGQRCHREGVCVRITDYCWWILRPDQGLGGEIAGMGSRNSSSLSFYRHPTPSSFAA